jgi:hypothetical protein
MPEFKNQHYVPQSYLRGFIDLKHTPKNYSPDALWSINKSTKEIKMKSINNICSQSYFYSFQSDDSIISNDIEHLLGVYESSFSEICAKCKIIREQILSGEKFDRIRRIEKKSICEYILFQYFRVPPFVLDFIDKTIPGFKEINTINGVSQTDSEIINDIKKLGFKYMFSNNEDSFINLRNIVLSKNMEISIIPDDLDIDFITSDSPALFANPHGSNALLSKDTEVVLAMSNKFAISFVNVKSYDTYSIIKNKQQVITFNRSLFRKCINNTFSGNPNRLMELI